MNNLRKFDTFEDYEEAELVKPAVSLIAEDDSVFFDQKEAEPEAFGGLTVIYDIEDASEVTLFNGGGGGSSGSESESGGGGAMPTRMIVDGVDEVVISTWRFDTTGEHTVQYEFEDNTVPAGFMASNHMATSIIVGDDIEVIGGTEDGGAFYGCGNIDIVEVGTGITEIGDYAFYYCTSMTIFSIDATTPPTLGTDVFAGHSNNLVIYVPNGEGDSYKYSSGWSDYASYIEENV